MAESVQRQRPRRSIFITGATAGVDRETSIGTARRLHARGWQSALLAVLIKLSPDVLDRATTRRISGY